MSKKGGSVAPTERINIKYVPATRLEPWIVGPLPTARQGRTYASPTASRCAH